MNSDVGISVIFHTKKLRLRGRKWPEPSTEGTVNQKQVSCLEISFVFTKLHCLSSRAEGGNCVNMRVIWHQDLRKKMAERTLFLFCSQPFPLIPCKPHIWASDPSLYIVWFNSHTKHSFSSSDFQTNHVFVDPTEIEPGNRELSTMWCEI